jgi:DNA-3-methyladenine glycosylase I
MDMHPDGLIRCPWVDPSRPDYAAYHDLEWGTPLHDDGKLFEFLILEGMQAGLSWYTILRKRENFREALDGFDPRRIVRYDEKRIDILMKNPGIIRNRAKLRAAVANARSFLEVQDEFGSFDRYMWGFVDHRPVLGEIRGPADYRATSPESDAMSRDLKSRGFRFVGSTICYAHMQATGMVNDHTVDCFRRAEILAYPDYA